MKMKSDVIWRNDGRFPIIFLRDHCLQNCHLGRQIVDLVDINKFRFTSMRKRNLRPKILRFSSHNDNFQYNCPRSKSFLFSFSLKLYNFATKASDASNVKPDVSQWKATLRNSVGFLTVYRRSVSIFFFHIIHTDVALYSQRIIYVTI